MTSIDPVLCLFVFLLRDVMIGYLRFSLERRLWLSVIVRLSLLGSFHFALSREFVWD